MERLISLAPLLTTSGSRTGRECLRFGNLMPGRLYDPGHAAIQAVNKSATSPTPLHHGGTPDTNRLLHLVSCRHKIATTYTTLCERCRIKQLNWCPYSFPFPNYSIRAPASRHEPYPHFAPDATHYEEGFAMLNVATFSCAAHACALVRYTRLRESNHRTTRTTTTMTTMAMIILPMPPLCTVTVADALNVLVCPVL